ncbi:MAG: ABC transporter ATP-binding protein [Bifidobacteriaceae bacterium]|jgi:peptide/nickel transport system ATP-binding protein|nr:ABC transporter ATP-binding protein [Bifidobacteriaceae bacterium]
MVEPVLALRRLSVAFDVEGRLVDAVKQASYQVRPGEIVAVVGESGSGKTVSALATVGLLATNARVSGEIVFDGRHLEQLKERDLRRIRGSQIAMISQEPVAALDPVFTIGFQLGEVVRLDQPGLPAAKVKARVVELLEMVEIPAPASRLRDYPHQFSGGMCQRILIAMALARSPKLLIADEPTTALDVTVQAEILATLRRVRQRTGAAILLITHNMGVVADMADQVVVMRDGEVVEAGPAERVFARPEHSYTRRLLAAVPRIGGGPPPGPADGAARGAQDGAGQTRQAAERAQDGAGQTRQAAGQTLDAAGQTRQAAGQGAGRAGPGGRRGPAKPPAKPPAGAKALEMSDLRVDYGSRWGRQVRAVDGVTLTLEPGETLGLVGESGSGKTTVGRAALGLAPVSGGVVRVAGLDIGRHSAAQRRAMRRSVGVVFQNPATSLNPRYSALGTVAEPLRVIGRLPQRAAAAKAVDLLGKVGLGEEWFDRYPHELSGGQRQRVAIARAIALDPVLLIADEPTSALDVSVQAQVLDTLRQLQAGQGFACLFISHDLAVVDSICRRVAVMHRGQVVETGDRSDVLRHPAHPYTRRLLASAPVPDPVEQRRRRGQEVAELP